MNYPADLPLESNRRHHYVSRLPVYRLLAEANLSDPEERSSQGLADKLRAAGMENPVLDNYWKRVEFVSSHCRGKVLEIGCGCGNLTRYISANPCVTLIDAVDLVPEYVQVLEAYAFPKVRAFCQDITTTDLPQKYDCVVLSEVIEHLTLDQEATMLARLLPFLNPEAIFVITTPIGFMPDPDHVRGFSPAEFNGHIDGRYGRLLTLADNGIQQFAVAVHDPDWRRSSPRISVVLPTYNHLEFLPQAIESIRCQTFKDYELIVVDDGSTDGTQEFLDSLDFFKMRVIHQENKRLPGALNTGMSIARGELITWISADNFCSPYFLEAFARAFDCFPDAGFACSAFAWIDTGGNITDVERDQDLNPYSLLTKHDFGIASFMYLKKCQDSVGLYNPELEGAEDWDMWLRITEAYPTIYVPEVLYYYRLHENSMTATKRQKICLATREAFNLALARRNMNLGLQELYPGFNDCNDQLTARYDACLDFGTRLLACDFVPPDYAQVFLQNAVNLMPQSMNAVALLSLAYAYNREWDKAYQLLERSLVQGRPWLNQLYEQIGWAMSKNSLAELPSIKDYAVDLSTSEIILKSSQKNRNTFSLTSGQPMKTENQAQSKTITDAEILLSHGNLLLQEGKFDGACRAFIQVVMNDPKNVAALTSLSATLLILGQIGDSKLYAQMAYDIRPEDPQISNLLGQICFREGNFNQAIEYLFTANQYTPEDENIFCLLGMCYLALQKFDSAGALFNYALFLNADNQIAAEYLNATTGLDNSAINDEPKVSVIVATKNRPETLRRAIASILFQTYRDFEIIVVNDGGEDVRYVIDGFNENNRIHYFQLDHSRRLPGARNFGINQSKGKYLAYLDDDDIFYPNHLETLMNELEANQLSVAYSDSNRAWQVQNGTGYQTTKRDVPYSHDFDYDRILNENFIPVLCFVHARECMDRVGLFDESLVFLEDWELWIRMSRQYEFRHVAKITCEFSWRQDGSTETSGHRPEFIKYYEIIRSRYRQFIEEADLRKKINQLENQLQNIEKDLSSARFEYGELLKSMPVGQN